MLRRSFFRWSLVCVALAMGWPFLPGATPLAPAEASLMASGQEPGPPASTYPPGPLGELNQLFLESYQTRRKLLRDETSPVIVISGSSLILRRAGQRESVRVIPDIFHTLKAFAHLPFAVYLRLAPPAKDNSELPDSLVVELRLFIQRIEAARAALSSAGLSPVQLKRQIAILDASSEIVSNTLEARRVDADTLGKYAQLMGPLMLANAGEAGCAQVQGMHKQVMSWKNMMSVEEWKSLKVVNRGKHQARYRSAATQYFQWLLKETGSAWSYPGESLRIIYAEFLGKDEDSVDLLTTVVLDADASRAFFGDSWRLSEDILSEGAAACVAQLPR